MLGNRLIDCATLAKLLETSLGSLKIYLAHYTLSKYAIYASIYNKRSSKTLAFILNPASLNALQKYLGMRRRKEYNMEAVRQYYRKLR